MNPEVLLVEGDLQLPGPLAYVRGARLEPRQPELGVHAAQHLGDGPRDQRVPFVRVVEKPPWRDDVAPADQRHGGVQELQSQCQPEVVRDVFEGRHLPQAGEDPRIQTGLLRPGQHRAAE